MKELNNLNFGDLLVGYLDAETEVRYNSDSFEEFFYDLNDTLPKLNNLNRPTALVIGRKGVGKSAYAAKMQLLNNELRESFIISLNEVSYNDFVKISDNKGNVIGTQRYLHAWYLLLLSTVIKKLNKNDVENTSALKLLKQLVVDLGLSLSTNIVRDIFTASKKDFKVKLSMLEVSISSNGEEKSGHEKIKFSNLTDFTNFFIDVFMKLGIKKEIYPVIDGVDDVLRNKKDIPEILSGLVRAVYSLNQKNFGLNKVKFILVIREDIIKSINDPDMNKIIHDSGYTLNWYTNKNSELDNLLLLFNKRITANQTLVSNNNINDQAWKHFFPFLIENRSSWNYFLEYTMYRPRDIVQFINQFIDNYPNETSATREMFRDELRNFSREYFYEEMKNELLGFLDDSTINELFDVLQKLGSKTRSNFKFADFTEVYNDNYPDYDIPKIKHIITTLFNSGYIGMLRKIKNRQNGTEKTYVNFKHKDPRLTIDFANLFIIHKGLFSALNI